MRNFNEKVCNSLAAQARTVAAALIAPFKRGESVQDIEAWITTLPLRQRRTIVGGMLGLMLIAAIAAAQFGLIGMCVFFLGIILLVR